MRPEPAEARAAYRAAAGAVGGELRRGRTVALLCEGDPLFYGSSARLLEFLDASWPVEIVPGVASPHAAAARLGHALSRRDDVFKVLCATLAPDRLAVELRAADAAAILKLGRRFDAVRALCDRLGLTSRAVLVEHATLPAERIVPLAEAEAGTKPYFSLILIPRADDVDATRREADAMRGEAATASGRAVGATGQMAVAMGRVDAGSGAAHAACGGADAVCGEADPGCGGVAEPHRGSDAASREPAA